jgi:3-deoxy-D-manno-octulosonic-acid transferase
MASATDKTGETPAKQQTLLLRLYRFVISLTGPLTRLILKRRLKQGKEVSDRVQEKQGVASVPRPDGTLIWVHGASVGESLSILPLINRITEDYPDYRFLVTTGTITSAQLMMERLPKNAIHQFIPLDYPAYVTRFLDHWQPDACIFVESELWPNLIQLTNARHIPMALVNGRISPKSFESWQKRPASAEALLSSFRIILAQDTQNQSRLQRLSKRDVPMYGNLKMAAPVLPIDDVQLDALKKQCAGRPLWLAASTHEGEEEFVLKAHQALLKKFPDLLTILAPRHPQRGDAVATLLDEYDIPFARRSQKQELQGAHQVYLADTLGELGTFYNLSEITFLGGSLVEIGGHNPLEPARLSCAILFGPHTFNFEDTYRNMRSSGGTALVRNERDLAASLVRLLTDDMTRQAMAKKAMTWADESAEAVIVNIVKELNPLLEDALAGQQKATHL